ncbi:Acg family FMN-binding oxidoreductase [Vineibacter terrae]|uniref:Acg family FMN-binding oxidoreductase n=1 Tax=Vineibacter terrae TaxID=2586908 RepID=UPI002E3110E5|nr:nitroreductase family protein [Vineibacter terrae]HEX2886961.1 nitroreductase family protein [Vineibacter terrae]
MAMARRNFIRVIGGGIVLAAGTAVAVPRLDAMPAAAVEGWRGPRPQERDPRRRALAWAMLAPNPHNMQAWLVDLRQPDEIVLHVDRERLLPQTDPFSRQIVVGQGTVLELLALALAAEGYRAEIVLFPAGEFSAERIDARPVARVRLVRDSTIKVDPLFAQIPRRRSIKTEYAKRPVSETHLAALTATHRAASDLTLDFATDPAALDALRAIAAGASEVEMVTPRTHKESIDRLRIGADEIATHRDGLVLTGPMIWALRHAGIFTRDKAMTPGTLAWNGGRDIIMTGYASAVAFGWIATPLNTRTAQVAAGRAYVRLNLKATELGVAMHPHSQALQEFAEMADMHRAIHKATGVPDGHTVQMFFRLGYAADPGPTPRRSPDSIVMA